MRPPWAWVHWPLTLSEPTPDAGSAGGPYLVHLVRQANGPRSLREHELVLAMKGFYSLIDAKPYLEEVEDLAPTALFLADRGFDLGVYFAVAARLRRDRYCFVNSHSRAVSDDWLVKLNEALDRPGVGQIGASGSWTSNSSSLLYWKGLPSAYRGVMPPRELFREQLAAIRIERTSIKALEEGYAEPCPPRGPTDGFGCWL